MPALHTRILYLCILSGVASIPLAENFTDLEAGRRFVRDGQYALAIEHFRAAESQSLSEARGELCALYVHYQGFDHQDPDLVHWIETAAQQDDSGAQYCLAVAYFNGIDRPADVNRGVEWARRSAARGNPRGKVCLGVALMNGEGVDKDTKQALVLFQSAAAAGNELAMLNLGVMFLDGIGVGTDYKKALEYFERGAKLGGIDSMVEFAKIEFNNTDFPNRVGGNYPLGERWLKTAAERGDPAAAIELSRVYGSGRYSGITKNPSLQSYWARRAVERYQSLSDRGNLKARAELGYLLARGEGADKDWTRGKDLIRQSAAGGVTWALPQLLKENDYDPSLVDPEDLPLLEQYAEQYAENPKGEYEGQGIVDMLARIFFFGSQTIHEDYGTALRWLQRDKLNSCFSSDALASIYANGRGVSRDIGKAIDLLKSEGQKTSSWTCFDTQLNLGRLYASEGVQHDVVQSQKWFETARQNAEKWDGAQKTWNGNSPIAAVVLGRIYRDGLGVSVDLAKAKTWFQIAADRGDGYAKSELERMHGTSTSTTVTTPPNLSRLTASSASTTTQSTPFPHSSGSASVSGARTEVDESLPLWTPTVRMALVIGNSRYGRTTNGEVIWPDLEQSPAKDADAMAARLRALQFQVTELKDLSLSQMQTALREFSNRIATQPDTLALLYFSGHGASAAKRTGTDGDDTYIIPVETDLIWDEDASYKAVALTDIVNALKRSRAGVIVLDACRNNALRRRTRSAITRGLGEPPPRPNRTLIAYSTAVGEVAENRPGQISQYTQLLIDEIGRPGAILESSFRRVRMQMVRLLNSQGHRNVQDPELTENLNDDIVLVPR